MNVLKSAGSIIAKPLSIIYRRSVADGYLPAHFRCARVVPVFKAGDTDCVKNYRPISVVSIFAQILERIIERKLYAYAETNIFPACQFGFRKKHNTTHAAISLVSHILSERELGKFCGVLFIDLSNAFPSVDHAILLQKLQHYGIRGHLLQWLGAYLLDRTMTIDLGVVTLDLLA